MRQRSPAVEQRNQEVLNKIRQIKSQHPFWGYRRTWATLKFIYALEVNKKRVYRLMKEHQLVVTKDTRLKAKRTPERSKPRPVRPNEWWGTDMTKVMIENVGWAYVVLVLDWYTKKIVGHYVGLQAKSWHWLLALDQAVNQQFPDGARGHGVQLMSDNGSQPTSHSYMKNCKALGIKQAFTSYNNPKGNADTERVIRTLKEELVWTREWRSTKELSDEVERWLHEYNETYLHSALGYVPPNIFEADFYKAQIPSLGA